MTIKSIQTRVVELAKLSHERSLFPNEIMAVVLAEREACRQIALLCEDNTCADLIEERGMYDNA